MKTRVTTINHTRFCYPSRKTCNYKYCMFLFIIFIRLWKCWPCANFQTKALHTNLIQSTLFRHTKCTKVVLNSLIGISTLYVCITYFHFYLVLFVIVFPYLDCCFQGFRSHWKKYKEYVPLQMIQLTTKDEDGECKRKCYRSGYLYWGCFTYNTGFF